MKTVDLKGGRGYTYLLLPRLLQDPGAALLSK
jgi:hypothetical protein